MRCCRGSAEAAPPGRRQADNQSSPRLGQSGPLTGLQLFTKVNCTLALLGQEAVVAPPENPTFPALAPQNLVITNTGGTIALKLTCPTSPGENTIVRGSRPQNSKSALPLRAFAPSLFNSFAFA